MRQATLSAGQSKNRVQKSARHRGSSTPGSPHSSQAAHPSKLAWPQLLFQPPPPTSAPLMTKAEPRHNSTFRRRPRQQTKRGRKPLEIYKDPSVTNPTVSELEHPSSASQDEDSEEVDFSALRKRRLSAPQLQAQLSRLTGRARLKTSEEHTPLQRKELGSRLRESETCATRTSPTGGFITWTRVREVS